MKKINCKKRGIAIFMAFILAVMPALPNILNLIETKASVTFGEFTYDDALVAEWEKAADRQFPEGNWERTDMQIFNTDAKSSAMFRIFGQTGGSASGKWKDYEWKHTYCVSHSTQMTDQAGISFESYPVWYAFDKYTLQNLPQHFIKAPTDELRKFNFLMMAYAANYDNYLGGPNSDPYFAGNYYTMQLICGLAERAEYTGEYEHDYIITKTAVQTMAETEFRPNTLGDNRIHDDMVGNFDRKFGEIWHTAKLLNTCAESTDDGYSYRTMPVDGTDGMKHVQMQYSEKLSPSLMSSKITTYGDWTYEFFPEYIDFKSPTGEIPSEGMIAEIDTVGAANIIGKHIGNESVLSIRTPVKLKTGEYSFLRTQENLVTCLQDGMKIFIKEGPDVPPPPPPPVPKEYNIIRYKHPESWQSNYTVNLRKFDSETGKGLENSKFDILEAFDSEQEGMDSIHITYKPFDASQLKEYNIPIEIYYTLKERGRV